MRIIPLLKLYEIRGHHLSDLADYLHAPERAASDYIGRGYGHDFVNNQARVFDDIISGRAAIRLIAGRLDATCKGNCQRFTEVRRGDQLPCEGDGIPTTEDGRIASILFLRIGETYLFAQIERNLRNFYADQHSM